MSADMFERFPRALVVLEALFFGAEFGRMRRVPHPRGLCDGGVFDFRIYRMSLSESIRRKRKEGVSNAKTKRPAPNGSGLSD